MIRAIALYPEAPDPERYRQHVEFCRGQVSEATVRHGPIFGSPTGKPDFAYYFEFEFADMDDFRRAGPALQKTAEDAQSLGVEYRVYFAEVE